MNTSTFMGLEISKKGLAAHQQALQTTGHNISNAENKDYSRQRVVITSADPLYVPSLNRAETSGNIGQGAVVAQVERLRNTFVDDRIVAENTVMGYWKTKDDFIYQVENVYNEPSDQSIRNKMDAMWSAWQELSKYPEQKSTREVVKEKAVALSNEISHVYRQLDEIQKDANRQVYAKVLEVNNYARDIRDLNERILKSEALGDNPNDLKDRRDALIDKLSEIVNISVGRSDKDELIVYISGENLVQGEVLHELQTIANPDKKGFYDVTWKKTGAKVYHEAGSLSGLIDVRDKILQDNLNNINSLAVNIVDLTNEVHRDGFGKNGETNINFFKEMTVSDNVEGNFDLNNDGYLDTTAIFKVAGKNKVDASAAIGITGTLTIVTNDELEASVPVDYTATDTVMSVMKKINDAKLGVSAYINHDGQLAIKATIAKDNESKNFMIRHLEDSGQFLVGLTGILKESGPNGAFNYNKINDIAKFLPDRESITIAPRHNPASYMAISKEVEINIDRIAASRGKDIGGTGDYNTTNGIGDGSNALGIANLRHKAAMVENNATFSDFYTSLISKIGSQGQEADDRVKNQETMLSNLGNLRESFSGINLDEEMANMVAFQHAYNANARMISTVDKMLETIIRLGS